MDKDLERLLIIAEHIRTGINKEANDEYTKLTIKINNRLMKNNHD